MIKQQQEGATMIQYGEFDRAYDFFNERLFDGQLPKVLVTFTRKKNMLGYYSPERWESASDATNRAAELSFNPDHFTNPQTRTLTDVLSTLVHEMTHCQQHNFGQPSRAGYHNVQWGGFMEAVGLMPSATGEVGGGKTGQQMTHYIVDGGPFAVAAAELLASGWSIRYLDRAAQRTGSPVAPVGTPGKVSGTPTAPSKPKTVSKVKFSCPSCKANAWGKPTLSLICGDCAESMI